MRVSDWSCYLERGPYSEMGSACYIPSAAGRIFTLGCSVGVSVGACLWPNFWRGLHSATGHVCYIPGGIGRIRTVVGFYGVYDLPGGVGQIWTLCCSGISAEDRVCYIPCSVGRNWTLDSSNNVRLVVLRLTWWCRPYFDVGWL